MCGRFTLTHPDYAELVERLGVRPAQELADESGLYRPRFNVAPTDLHWIVKPTRPVGEPTDVLPPAVLAPARWGLLNFWAQDPRRAARPINARIESVHRQPAFRNAFRK